jgi:hypothetical protein
MKARAAIGSAVFGSREVKIISEAFEDIWKAIEPDYRHRSPEVIEAIRLKLAQTVLALAKNGDPNKDRLVEVGFNFFRASIQQNRLTRTSCLESHRDWLRLDATPLLIA